MADQTAQILNIIAKAKFLATVSPQDIAVLNEESITELDYRLEDVSTSILHARGFETVVFHWSTRNGPCIDCGRPAAFHVGQRTAHSQYCALCAANHAADGERIGRIPDHNHAEPVQDVLDHLEMDHEAVDFDSLAVATKYHNDLHEKGSLK